MENATRSDEGGELQRRAAGRPFWDPFGILRGFVGWWDPLGVLRLSQPAQPFAPAFDGRDTEDAYILEADLPGIEETELEMSVTGTELSVSGKRESGQREESGRYFCSERAYGTFVRTFTLPDDAELARVSAEFRDGVLRVKIPKRTDAQTRRIALTAARSGDKGGQRQPAAGGRQQAGARPAPPRQLGGARTRPRRQPKDARSRPHNRRRSASR
jgi:HSP20 family protein